MSFHQSTDFTRSILWHFLYLMLNCASFIFTEFRGLIFKKKFNQTGTSNYASFFNRSRTIIKELRLQIWAACWQADAKGENGCLAHDNKKDKWRALYNLLALDIFRRPLEMLLSLCGFQSILSNFDGAAPQIGHFHTGQFHSVLFHIVRHVKISEWPERL